MLGLGALDSVSGPCCCAFWYAQRAACARTLVSACLVALILRPWAPYAMNMGGSEDIKHGHRRYQPCSVLKCKEVVYGVGDHMLHPGISSHTNEVKRLMIHPVQTRVIRVPQRAFRALSWLHLAGRTALAIASQPPELGPDFVLRRSPSRDHPSELPFDSSVTSRPPQGLAGWRSQEAPLSGVQTQGADTSVPCLAGI
jgi:hypothetical protein